MCLVQSIFVVIKSGERGSLEPKIGAVLLLMRILSAMRISLMEIILSLVPRRNPAAADHAFAFIADCGLAGGDAVLGGG